MTDRTIDEIPENQSDIDTRLTLIEAAIRDLRDMIAQQDQRNADETPRLTPVTLGSDRLEAARPSGRDALAKARDRVNDAARGAGLPVWAVIVIGVLAVIGVADLVDLDMPGLLDL